MRPVALALVALLLAGGCTHSVHQYTVSDSVPGAACGRVITAEATDKDWLWSNSSDFADHAYHRLLAQCPRGEISGVHARHSTSHGFLYYKNKLVLRALCSPAPPGALANRQ